MLVLSRHRNQSLVILLPDGKTITVKVVEVKGQTVRIGFDAPKDVKIWRQEIRPDEKS